MKCYACGLDYPEDIGPPCPGCGSRTYYTCGIPSQPSWPWIPNSVPNDGTLAADDDARYDRDAFNDWAMEKNL